MKTLIAIVIAIVVGASCSHNSGKLARTSYRDTVSTGSYYEPNELTDDPEDYPRTEEKVVILSVDALPMSYNSDTWEYKVKRLNHGVVDYTWDDRKFEVGDTIFASFY